MEERRKYETQISERLAVVETEIKEIKADVRVIYKNIVGNDGEGLRIEVDRLKQFRDNHGIVTNRLWGFISAVAVLIVGKIIWDMTR